jgi:hypothetical protein
VFRGRRSTLSVLFGFCVLAAVSCVVSPGLLSRISDRIRSNPHSQLLGHGDPEGQKAVEHFDNLLALSCPAPSSPAAQPVTLTPGVLSMLERDPSMRVTSQANNCTWCQFRSLPFTVALARVVQSLADRGRCNLSLQIRMAANPVAVGFLIDDCFVAHAKSTNLLELPSLTKPITIKSFSFLRDSVLKTSEDLKRNYLYSDAEVGARLAGMDHLIATGGDNGEDLRVDAIEDKLTVDVSKLKSKLTKCVPRLRRFIAKVFQLTTVKILLDGKELSDKASFAGVVSAKDLSFTGTHHHAGGRKGIIHYHIVAFVYPIDFAANYNFVHVVSQSDLRLVLSQDYADQLLSNDCVQHALVRESTKTQENFLSVVVTAEQDKRHVLLCHKSCTKRVLSRYIRHTFYGHVEDFSSYAIRQVGGNCVQDPMTQPLFIKSNTSPQKTLPPDNTLSLVVTRASNTNVRRKS